MSRWSREEWLRDLSDREVLRLRERIETDGFWHYVDSQANAHTHLGECETRFHPTFGERVICTDWRHVRGDGCLAATSLLLPCQQATLPGLPFCAAHFDNAWKAVSAFVSTDRIKQLTSEAEFDLERRIEGVCDLFGIDAAMVEDARRVLAKLPERVYFFATEAHVKIGRSRNPEQRVKTFGATLTPEGVDWRKGRLLGLIPGGAAVENALHQRFAAHRVVGEWFHLEPVSSAIAALIDEHSLADTG
jgi:hypothetical protein